jgi:hypothetical protein
MEVSNAWSHKIIKAIIGYFWLLKSISPYVIISNFRLL